MQDLVLAGDLVENWYYPFYLDPTGRIILVYRVAFLLWVDDAISADVYIMVSSGTTIIMASLIE